MICELLKTTPYLTGQVRLDIVADHLSGDANITLDEVHVVPLNDSIWYNCPEDQINFRHSENIVSLYNSIQDRFYSASGNSMLYGKYPYLGTDHDSDTVDHTYQMGLKRTSKSKYGKDFAFFLPMWIDEDVIDDLEFFATVSSASTHLGGLDTEPTVLTTKKLEISDRLRKYLKDWFSGISSDLMYIGIGNNTAYMSGLNVSNGTTMTKDISGILKYLFGRERPLLETDNMICRQFSENIMVAKQIMNFCFHFSTQDLFLNFASSETMWCPLNMVVEAKLKNSSGTYDSVSVKDLYSNYSDIYSYKINDNPLKPGMFVEGRYVWENEDWDEYVEGEDRYIKKYNVLDYLDDTNCIDMVHDNKMVQPTVHWAFTDNLNYTWNLYNGFSPIVSRSVDGHTVVNRIEGRFFGTPDVISENYDVFKNNIRWIYVFDGTSGVVPSTMVSLSMAPSTTTHFKPNKFGTFWSNGIKYNMSTVLEDGADVNGTHITSNEIRANICIIRDSQTDNLDPNSIYCAVSRKIENDEFVDYISFVGVMDGGISTYEGLNYLTYQSIRNGLSGNYLAATPDAYGDVFGREPQSYGDGRFNQLFVIYGNQSGVRPPQDYSPACITELFKKVLETIEYPTIVRYDKTLVTVPAAAPSIDKLVEGGYMEVTYAKEKNYMTMDGDYSTYLFRYGGSIVPQMIDPNIYPVINDSSDRWRVMSSGTFNLVYRKKQWKDISNNSRKCLNYISKQKFQPDYPSIDYYYFESEKLDIDNPYVPEGYNGEVCWFKNNMIYAVPRQFTLERNGITTQDMELDDIKDMFYEHVVSTRYFSSILDADNRDAVRDTIMNYIWNMYSYHTDWEYASLTDINEYNFKVTYSLI